MLLMYICTPALRLTKPILQQQRPDPRGITLAKDVCTVYTFLPYLPEPVGGGGPRGVEGLDHGGVGHVRAPAQIYEISVAVHRRAPAIRYPRGDVLPGRHLRLGCIGWGWSGGGRDGGRGEDSTNPSPRATDELSSSKAVCWI